MNLLKIIGYQVDFNSLSQFKFFDLNSQEFIQIKSNSSIVFPFELLVNHNISKSHLNDVKNFFLIFETVFVKNHLSNSNLQLPNQYQLFKKMIIEFLSS
tara:strand:+ start:77 stop:373 length:297 start_codon:yes stop_codon:yes gene_type:complete